MLKIKFFNVEASFDELKDEWKCANKTTCEILERHWVNMFKSMPWDVPYRVRGTGGYIVDNLREIYGDSAVKVLHLKPANVPSYDKDGNPVIE